MSIWKWQYEDNVPLEVIRSHVPQPLLSHLETMEMHHQISGSPLLLLPPWIHQHVYGGQASQSSSQTMTGCSRGASAHPPYQIQPMTK